MRSAGVLLYRADSAASVSVYLGHMGGPFWARKDAGAWSIPKGEPLPGEHDLAAALREFAEEIGVPAPEVPYEHLGEFRYSSGKLLTVFAGEADFQPEAVVSNLFDLEWPPHSGRIQQFPEFDDARWFTVAEARQKVVKGQLPMLDAVELLVRLRLG